MRGRKTGLQRTVEDIMGEPLERLFGAWYAEGLSPWQIAHRLQERGICVSGQSVLNWTRALGFRRVLINERPAWRLPEPA